MIKKINNEKNINLDIHIVIPDNLEENKEEEVKVIETI